MSKDRRTFVFNIGWADDMEDLDNEARLKFFDAIIAYAKSEKMPDNMNNMEMVIFKSIKRDIDMNNEKFESTKQKRAEAGRKGGVRSGEERSKRKQNEANEANASLAKQTEAKESKAKQTEANEAEYENEYEYGYENGYENGNVPIIYGGDIISTPAQEENLSLNHQARDFVRFFNEKTEGTCIPQVKKITEKREIAIGRILHTMGRETMEEVIIRATSPNCILATENRGVGIDWFINEDNAIKVLEGNYDNTRTNQQGTGLRGQEARHHEQLRQLAGGDPERLAYLEATYKNGG